MKATTRRMYVVTVMLLLVPDGDFLHSLSNDGGAGMVTGRGNRRGSGSSASHRIANTVDYDVSIDIGSNDRHVTFSASGSGNPLRSK